MSQYLVLSHIAIQNANAIAGLTWGFPAITQFLGFTHALTRKLSSDFHGRHAIELKGCAVISHTSSSKVYKPKVNADFEFLQSKNPPVLAKHKNASPPIIEEGKMNLTVSLVIEINQPLNLANTQVEALEKEIFDISSQMRLAGGNILSIEKAKLFSASTEKEEHQLLRKIKRLIMPGFMLLDRSYYLEAHYQDCLKKHADSTSGEAKPELLDAWLDFSALKYQATHDLMDGTLPDPKTPAAWNRVPKPEQGWLVPIMTGYKAISPSYDGGVVLNTRDNSNTFAN